MIAEKLTQTINGRSYDLKYSLTQNKLRLRWKCVKKISHEFLSFTVQDKKSLKPTDCPIGLTLT